MSVSVPLSSRSVLRTELPQEVYCETKPLNHLTAKRAGERLPLLTCVREVCVSNPYAGFHDFSQSLHINTYGITRLGNNRFPSITLQFVIRESSCRQFNPKSLNDYIFRKKISFNEKESQPETTTARKVRHHSL